MENCIFVDRLFSLFARISLLRLKPIKGVEDSNLPIINSATKGSHSNLIFQIQTDIDPYF